MAEEIEGKEEVEEGTKEEFPATDGSGLRIEIARKNNGTESEPDYEFYWLLYAGNGRRLATGAVAYNRLNDLKNGIAAVAESIGDAPIVRLY